MIRIIRMTQNLNNAKIYKITNDYNDDVYVGSTCDTLQKRFYIHKAARTCVGKKNRPLYALMNEIGIDRFRIDLIEEYPCKDKMSLRQREGFFIRNIGTLNKQIEGRTKKVWDEDNKIHNKEYRKANAEKIREKQREYREKNKEEIKLKSNIYHQKNKDKINNRHKGYYLEKKNLDNNKEENGE